MSPCSDEEHFYKLDNLVILSTQYLRQIFRTRWKIEIGENWKDEPNYIKTFLIQHCENILKKTIPLQTKILNESCSLEDWDMSLMSLVLLNFGHEKKYKLQNQAVRQLKVLRNDLAHHKSKRLTQTEYFEKIKILQESLQILKIKKSEIEKFVNGSSVSASLGDTERLNAYFKNAEQFMKSKEFEKALQQYSEAILIPNLSPVSLGETYEKRAACHLSIKDGQNVDEKHIDQALLDIKQALKLNISSWNAYYLKGHCQKVKNNLPEAIRYYRIALAISPIQKQVKKDLDSTYLLESMQRENANLNLDKLPTTVSDIVGDMKYKCGHSLSLKHYGELYGLQNSPIFLGQNYYYGLEVTQNYEKALEYFVQADKQGSAVGCLMVGHCYYLGHGVEQDVSKSVEIFKRCAKIDPKKKIKLDSYTTLDFNFGVSSAEYSIGKCYDHGTGVEENFVEAANWYTRAMEHGDKDAASCLGLLYYTGHGVATDHKMAEMCWKQSLNLGSTESAEYLMMYYQDHLEPEMAWTMLKIGREMGCSRLLEMTDVEFNQKLVFIQSERWRLDEQVTMFEKIHNFGFKGMSFGQRVKRSEEPFNFKYEMIHDSKRNAVGFKSISGRVRQLSSVLEWKEYLKSPVRKALILQHRDRLKNAATFHQDGVPFDDKIVPGKFQQTRGKKMADLKCITLQEMNPTTDRIYENRILDLTFIEEPILCFNSIQLVAEDDNGDTTRVYVDPVTTGNVLVEKVSVGCRIAIINPYMGICAKNGVNGIRINEPKCIIYLERVKNPCRFCEEEIASHKCSKYNRMYCSKECQLLDGQLSQNKPICSIVPKNKSWTTSKYIF